MAQAQQPLAQGVQRRGAGAADGKARPVDGQQARQRGEGCVGEPAQKPERIEEGAVVTNSIIMGGTVIKTGAKVEKAIIAENCVIGENTELGFGEEAENKYKPNVYAGGLVTIGEYSTIPGNVRIGKNTAVIGRTTEADYPDGVLESGGSIIR